MMPDVVSDEGCNEVVAMIITLEDKIRHCSVPFRNPDINVSPTNELFKLSCHLISLYMLQKATESEAFTCKHTWAHVPPWKEEEKILLPMSYLYLRRKELIHQTLHHMGQAESIPMKTTAIGEGNATFSEYKVSSFERKTLRLDELLRVLKYQWPGEQHHLSCNLKGRWNKLKVQSLRTHMCVYTCMCLNSQCEFF